MRKSHFLLAGIWLLAYITIALLFIDSSTAFAKVLKTTLGSNRSGKSSIALDPGQQPHVAYQAADYRLHHAWRDGKRWYDEVVDTISDSGWWNSIAVDSQGHVHISYHAERRDPYQQVLGYAVFDGTQWQITDVGDGGYSTSIALDANEHPQIVHYGGGGSILNYSTFDGVAWDTQDTGLPGGLWFFPTALALDADDTAHISFTSRSAQDSANYAMSDLGGWDLSVLDSQDGGNVTTALALDSLDRPQVAVTFDQTIRYHRFDGSQWQSEDVFTLPGITQYPDAVALALDTLDQPHLLFSTFFSVGGGGANVTFYTFFDGMDWRGILVDKKNAGFDVSIAVDSNRVVHGTYRLGRGNRSVLKYVQITIPDITGSWISSGVTEAGGVTTVNAVLAINNQGSDSAKSSPVVFYLSDDASLDGSDELVPLKRKSGGVKPGVTKDLSVSFQHPGSLVGKYLIAIIDPGRVRDDLDRLNNTVAVLLGP